MYSQISETLTIIFLDPLPLIATEYPRNHIHVFRRSHNALMRALFQGAIMDYLAIRNIGSGVGGAAYGGSECGNICTPGNGSCSCGEIDTSGLWRQLDELQRLAAGGHLSPQV